MTPEEFDVLYERFLTDRLTPEEGERLRACLADPSWQRRWRDLSDLDGMLAEEFQGTKEEAADQPPQRPLPQIRRGRPIRPRQGSQRITWTAVAAAAAVLAGLSVWMAHTPQEPREEKPVTNPGTKSAQKAPEERPPAPDSRLQPLMSEAESKPPVPAMAARVETEQKPPEKQEDRIVEAPPGRQETPDIETAPPEVKPEPPSPTVTALAHVDVIEGNVFVLSGGLWSPCREGQDVLPGAGIRAEGKNSSAAVLFPDGSRLMLAADATIARIDGPTSEAGLQVELAGGCLSADVVHQPAGRPLGFVTPHAKARILGTKLWLGVGAEATRLEVQEGRVQVTRRSDGAVIEVVTGHFAMVQEGLALVSKLLPPTPVVKSFQDGLLPDPAYAGTRDASISELNPVGNLGTAASLEADGDDGGKDISVLIRWDVSSIPPHSRVLSAEIAVTITGTSGGEAYKLYEVRRAWSEGEVSWKSAAAGHGWQSPGVRGRGDRSTVPMGAIAASEMGERVVTLNEAGIAVVQSWVNAPTANFGLIITETATTDGLRFSSREASPSSQRPKLTVTYIPPAKR